LRWVAPGITADSLVLVLANARGASTRAVMVPEQGDTAVSGAPAPGHYSYDIAAYSAGKEVARARGPVTVETYSPEFMRRSIDLERLTNPPTALARAAGRAGVGRPLHTYSWLYVVLVALLCVEWILRRRWGLR
jgi:hypothetical protein